jgi:TM2 domain-containing membrane protein YozV
MAILICLFIWLICHLYNKLSLENRDQSWFGKIFYHLLQNMAFKDYIENVDFDDGNKLLSWKKR